MNLASLIPLLIELMTINGNMENTIGDFLYNFDGREY